MADPTLKERCATCGHQKRNHMAYGLHSPGECFVLMSLLHNRRCDCTQFVPSGNFTKQKPKGPIKVRPKQLTIADVLQENGNGGK